jgi:hypothetical protein
MTDEEMRALIGTEPPDLIVCGGSHVPFDRTVEIAGGSSVRIVNVGSVGEALDAGSARHANATFLDFSSGRLDVEQFIVPLKNAA